MNAYAVAAVLLVIVGELALIIAVFVSVYRREP